MKLFQKYTTFILGFLTFLNASWFIYQQTVKRCSKTDDDVVHNRRANAVILILARNTELDDLRQSLVTFEFSFNNRFNYPYVFLNDEPFSEDFKESMNKLIMTRYSTNDLFRTRNVSFGVIPKEHWSLPDWIDQQKAAEVRRQMKTQNVMHGGSASYRHMCRFYSGFFYRHPLLAQYDFYWRIEPGGRFYCQISYDPFVFMLDNKIEYGFIQLMAEIKETVPTLWNTTKRFMKEIYPQLHQPKTSTKPADSVIPPLSLLVDTDNESKIIDYVTKLVNEPDNELDERIYNVTWVGCHFWSNFEIAHFGFFRSPLYQKFFEYLDKTGGFYYERWGDAPIHSLAVGLFLNLSQVHHFRDIGYEHHKITWCPTEAEFAQHCSCDVDYNQNMASHVEVPCMSKCLMRMKNYGK